MVGVKQFEAVPCYDGFVIMDHINQELTYLWSDGSRSVQNRKHYDEETWSNMVDFLRTNGGYYTGYYEFMLNYAKVIEIFGLNTVFTVRSYYES